MSKGKYSDMDDEQLIVRIHDGGEDDITDHIMNKYKNLVRKKAASMYILGADRDDLRLTQVYTDDQNYHLFTANYHFVAA